MYANNLKDMTTDYPSDLTDAQHDAILNEVTCILYLVTRNSYLVSCNLYLVSRN
jgi:hypothetical protein